MYKKRSQSSLRSKTQQSQEDYSENYWIGNVQAKKVLSKVNQKITSSMIESNKENSQINIPIYQSVTQVGYDQQKYDKSLIISLQEKCKNYEKQLTQFYEVKNTKKGYNYADRFYQGEINELKHQISSKNKELEKYQNLYESKIDELDDKNDQISSRIQKNQTQKNLYIKEINVKSIEIKKLRETVELYKSQKENQNIFIKEQKATINELTSKSTQNEENKKKMQEYEQQLRQSHITLKEIQTQMEKIVEQAQNKDKVIQQNSKLLIELSQNIEVYEREIKMLEKEMIIVKDKKKEDEYRYQEKVRENESMKQQVYDVRKQLQTIPELQIKLKNSCSTVDDLRVRNQELVSTNEKLKIDLGNYKSLQYRIQELQEQNTRMKKVIREKQEQIEGRQDRHHAFKRIQQQNSIIRNKNKQLQNKLNTKNKQIRQLGNKVAQGQNMIGRISGQLNEYRQENRHLKEQRKSQIQSLFRDNNNMRESLLQKIDQIQQLQRKITNLQSKNMNILNQNSKYKAIIEGREQEINQITHRLQTMKNRWETQMGARIGLEEKCNRYNQQIYSLQSKIQNLITHNQELTTASQVMMQEFETQKQQLCQELKSMDEYRIQAQCNLQESGRRIEEMSRNIGQLKTQVQQLCFKEREHKVRIGQMETRICQLTEKLSLANRQIQFTRNVSVQMQQLNARIVHYNPNQ